MEEQTPLFTYQLKSNLEQLISLVEKLPGIIPEEIRQNADASFDELRSQIERSKKYLEAFQSDLAGFQEKACNLYDEAYLKIRDKKKETDERMEILARLPEIKCNIPYNFKELLDVAERLGHLTDEQFGRVIDLAKAFGKGQA